jgi:hypothetical protein
MNPTRQDVPHVCPAALPVGWRVEEKWRQVVRSRKVWAGLIGLGVTLGLWALGEIDGPATVEALTWVVSIFIGAVALEDGLAQLIRGLAAALIAQTPAPGPRVEPDPAMGQPTDEAKHDELQQRAHRF